MKPVDTALYNRIKRRIYKQQPKHSAYRSGRIVREYKVAFRKKHGSRAPYTGTKRPLATWFSEKWRNSRGEVGYQKPGDIYRPTVRVSKRTPVMHAELSASQRRAAMKEKRATGRVKRFAGIQKSTRADKKYMFRKEGKLYHFGARGMQQYKDQTGLGLYKRLDHGDSKRRKAFFLRMTGATTKSVALQRARAKGHWAKWASIKYLW